MSLKNVVVNGQEYSGIGEVNLQISGGGTARFIETSDADALASDISQGKKAYVKGNLVTGTNSGGGGGGITPFFAADVFETQFTPDSKITSAYVINHTLGVAPNIVEFFANSGQAVSEQCLSGGYVCVFNPVPDTPTQSYKGAFYYTPASGNTSDMTKIDAGSSSYIGTGPTSEYAKIYATSEYPLLAGITYTMRMYAFK